MPDAPAPAAPVAAQTKPQEAKAPPPAAAEKAAKAAPVVKGAAAAAPPVTPAEVIRMLKVPLDGLGDLELPEAEVLKLAAQTTKLTAEERKAAKELEQLRARLKDDPEGVMAELGLDPDQRAESRLAKKLQAELDAANLTPEQKELRDLKAKLADRERTEKEQGEKAKLEKDEAEVAHHREAYGKVIQAALEATSLPVTPALAKRMAAKMLQNAQHGLDIPSAMLARLVEAEVADEHVSVLKAMDPEKLFDRLGEPLVRQLVKAFAKRQGLQAAAAATTPGPAKKLSAEDKRKEERLGLRELSNIKLVGG